jgi:hypothetical protein
MGAVLLYGAFSKEHRTFAISLVAISKTIFVTLVVLYGRDFLDKVGPAIAMDSLVVAFACVFLVSVRKKHSQHGP